MSSTAIEKSYGVPPDTAGTARTRAVIQAIQDFLGGDAWSELRMLDLGAGYGQIAAESATRGATVVAVDARRQNLDDIARFHESPAIDPDRLQLVEADVRGLDWDALGAFDVIICSGLLYHLPLDAGIKLLAELRPACKRLTVIDTEVAPGPETTLTLDGLSYAGRLVREHAPGDDEGKRLAERFASMDYQHSFWPTRPTLHAMLARAGYSSSYELGQPAQPRREGRATILAVVSDQVDELLAFPDTALADRTPVEFKVSAAQRAEMAWERAKPPLRRARDTLRRRAQS